MIKSRKEEGWHLIDLHVHTPASKDYKGDKDRAEYKEIIMKIDFDYKKDDAPKKERSSKINLIAITDHNTVDGFKTIMDMKKETSDLIIKLKERDPNLEIIKELQKEEELFSSVHILMGVEIKPDPGIHFIIIFHEEIKPEMVDDFLSDGIGTDLMSFKGNAEPMLKWNIAQTLDEISRRFPNKAFVIAPHIDSNCGLFESLKDLPQPRMIALKNPILKAVSFNNVETRNRIKNLLQSPDYKRELPLIFLQDSDYHGETGSYIGSSNAKVYFSDKRINYSTLFEALSQERNVKCSADFVEELYNDLIEGFNVQRFTSYTTGKLSFNESDYRLLCDTICAYSNSEGGIVEIAGNISISDDSSKVAEDLASNLKTIFSSRLKPLPTFSLKILRISNTKCRALIMFKSARKLFMSDGNVLIFKNNNYCPAEPHEIEYIVARNLNRRFGYAVEQELEDLTFQTKRFSKIQRSFPIVLKYDHYLKKSFVKTFDVDFLKVHNKIDSLEELYRKYSNGLADGNIGVSIDSSPRLSGAYLRFSTPAFNLQEQSLSDDFVSFQKTSGILVSPSGGLTITSDNKHLHTPHPTLLLYLKTANDLLFYSAWFKSSFFLWYCATMLGDINLFNILFNKRTSIILPSKHLLPQLKNVSTHVQNLIIDEKKFLKESSKLIDKESDPDEIRKLTEKHNKVADSICRLIDFDFFTLLGINAKEALEIYKTIKYLEIYDFNVSDTEEYQKKLEELDKTLHSC